MQATLAKMDDVHFVHRLEELNALTKSDVGGLIYQRSLPDYVRTWFDHLPPSNLRDVNTTFETKHLVREVEMACHEAGLPKSSQRDWVQEDIVSQAEMFANMMQASSMRLRLDIVTDNACAKFHIDNVYARLICTYRGPGTQYCTSQDNIPLEPNHSVPTGSPIILKGKKWPDKVLTPLRHRSPPIEGQAITRVVLVLDPL
jgi:hypothetical protein